MNTSTQKIGPAIMIALAVGYPILWVELRPDGTPAAQFIAEVCGVEAVLLLSCALVLATLLRPIERAFGGLDRVALWHRGAATVAVVLLVPHIALITSSPDPYETSFGHALGDVAAAGLIVLTVWALAPKLRAARWPGPVRRLARLSYERWLTAHRLTGLFVAVAVVHGTLVDPVLHRSTPLRVAFLIAGVTGVAAYVYRELIARWVIPIYDYTVADVERPSPSTVVLSLDGSGRSFSFVPGQFVALAFGGENGWQRHPFSIASAPGQARLEVAIKATGDYTQELQRKLRPGTPAKLAGPFGGFDYQTGGDDQIWIAGGIGITPFMSWIRAMNGDMARTVDLFYSVATPDDALYLEEITAAASAHPGLHTHLIETDRQPYLTAKAALGDRSRPGDPWIYMCGPPPMMHALAKGFRSLGVPPGHVRWEQFDIR
jgi:predicted ferric reductase